MTTRVLAPSAHQKLPPLEPGEFRYVTKGLSIEPPAEGGDGKRRFKMVMSSTMRDARGDEVKLPALEKMARQFGEGRTIFMNHERRVQDAFGRSDWAEVRQTGDVDEKGMPIWDLHVAGVINDPNPVARQLGDSIEGGYVKFGASIGVTVNKKGIKRNEAGGLDIFDLETKEGSIVGIPMQQRSWVYKAADAAEALTEEDDEDEEEVMSGDLNDDPQNQPAADTPAAGEGDAATVEAESETAEKALDTAEGAALQRDDLNQKADGCPHCGGSKSSPKDDCHDGYHSAEKADTVVTETSEETVTSGVQESEDAETPETTPTDKAESDPDEIQKLLTVPEGDISALVKHVERLVTVVGEQQGAIAKLKAERDEAIRERDEVKSEVGPAKEVIKTVLGMPLRPRAVGHIAQFSERFPQFDPAIAEYLTKRGDE